MPEEPEELEPQTPKPTKSRSGTGFLIFVLVAIAALGTAFGYQQHQQVTQLEEQGQQMTAEMSTMREQVDTVNAKLTALAAATVEPTATGGAVAKNGSPAKAARRVDDRRIRQLQAKVNEQGKQLEDTRQAVEQTRTDLEGRLSSTRDELDGSIARTHDELVLLKKQGENEYFEFALPKAKTFQRVGPISVSLRKADTKHKTYDIAFLVDDNQLTKKKVNLYEPIWIHRTDDPHPMQLVIFKVEKNRVQGYVTAPKFKQSDLVATSAPAPPEH